MTSELPDGSGGPDRKRSWSPLRTARLTSRELSSRRCLPRRSTTEQRATQLWRSGLCSSTPATATYSCPSFIPRSKTWLTCWSSSTGLVVWGKHWPLAFHPRRVGRSRGRLPSVLWAGAVRRVRAASTSGAPSRHGAPLRVLCPVELHGRSSVDVGDRGARGRYRDGSRHESHSAPSERCQEVPGAETPTHRPAVGDGDGPANALSECICSEASGDDGRSVLTARRNDGRTEGEN